MLFFGCLYVMFCFNCVLFCHPEGTHDIFLLLKLFHFFFLLDKRFFFYFILFLWVVLGFLFPFHLFSISL